MLSYTIILSRWYLVILLIYTCDYYDTTPPLRGIVQDLCFPKVMLAFWGHFRIPIWPFHVEYAIKLVIYCFRPIHFCMVATSSVGSGTWFFMIVHGSSRDMILPSVQNFRTPILLFQPFLLLHVMSQLQISGFSAGGHFFITRIRVQGISRDPNLELMIRELFQI